VVVAAQEDGKGIGRIRTRQIPTASAEYLMPLSEMLSYQRAPSIPRKITERARKKAKAFLFKVYTLFGDSLRCDF